MRQTMFCIKQFFDLRFDRHGPIDQSDTRLKTIPEILESIRKIEALKQNGNS